MAYVWEDKSSFNTCIQSFLVPSAGAWMHVPPAGHGDAKPSPPGWTLPSLRISQCAVEVDVPWRALQCLTPDAMQLADPAWAPVPHP